MLDAQKGVCAVCFQVPACKKLCIDHVHVKGWRKMKPEERRVHVRGLVCSHCNHRLVNKYLTIRTLEMALVYLKSVEARTQS